MNKLNKNLLVFGITFLVVTLFLSIGLVNAVSQEELNDARALIDSKITCDKLTNDQLEIIGEYYMEQMMPGEAHKRAHEMMGLKEGSEAEEQFHINLAKRSYCSGNIGMMTGGMMGNNYQNPQYNNFYQNNFFGFQIFFYIFLTLVIIILILVIILLINKSRNSSKRRRGDIRR